MADRLEIMLELERRGKLPEDKSEILAELRRRGKLPEFTTESKSETKGFISRLKEDYQKRSEKIDKAFAPTDMEKNAPLNESIGESIMQTPRRILRVAGQAAGMIGDVGAEAVESITPESLKKTMAEAIEYGIKRTPNSEKFIQGVSETAKKHPYVTGAIEDVANISGLIGGARLRGKLPDAPPSMPSRVARLNAERNTATRNLADKWNIPTTLGEDLGNVTLQKSETLLEKVPVLGIRNFREKQLVAADDAAKGFLARYISNPDKPDFWGNKEYIDSLYNQVKDEAAKINITSKAGETSKASKELLERYPSIFTSIQDNRTKNIVKNIISDTSEFKQPGAIGNITFDDLWSLRKGLGTAKENARTQGNMEAVGILGKIQKSVDDDIESIGKASGSTINEKLKVANDAYKHYNVKYEMIQKAYDVASGKKGALEMFSPKKFSTELKNLVYKNKDIKKNQLFKPDEIEEITGLANIMQTVKRAGQFAENPPTGNRLVDLMLGGGFGYGVAAHPGATATAATTAGILKFLTTTKKGKNIARIASKMKPNSETLNNIAFRVAKEGQLLAPVSISASAQGE